MADYYPLLAKAAAGPSGATREARQAMYARARKALLAQLRAHDPPAALEDIQRENDALDAAIARVETELFPVEPDSTAEDTSVHADSVHAVEDALASEATPPDHAGPLLTGDPAPSDVPSRDASARDLPPSDLPSSDLPSSHALASDASTSVVPPPDLPPSNVTLSDRPASDGPEKNAVRAAEARPDADLRLRPRDRPLAPTPPPPRKSSTRPWVFGGAVAAVAALVAGAAFYLRESPEDLARRKPVAAPTAETAANGKLVERVGGNDPPSPAAPAGSRAVNGPAVTPAPTVTQAPIPVAARSALLVQAPDLESKIRSFTGSAVWRLDNVPAASGPLGTAVHADVELPEAKVRLTIDIRKNTDPALPASNTIEIRFSLAPGSALPGIDQIGQPQMRREESPNGDALSGVPVKITDTYFLVGLAQGEVEKRNADLLRTRAWFDIPVQLTDNRIAKITVEKGPTGDRIITDALSTWAQ